jgi:hypothetical protein
LDLVRPSASRVTWSLTLPVAPPVPPAEARLGDRHQGPFPRRQTIATAFQIRSAFHRRVPSASLRAGAWNESIAAATDASVWPPQLSFRHAFTRWSRARPTALAGYSPGLVGHVPLVDFCNCMDPQAQPRPRQTPPLVHGGNHRTAGSAPPGGCAASWAFAVQGSRGHSRALVTPTPTSCVSVDLPQTVGPRHLLSLPDAVCGLENVRQRRLAGYQPLRRLLSKP